MICCVLRPDLTVFDCCWMKYFAGAIVFAIDSGWEYMSSSLQGGILVKLVVGLSVGQGVELMANWSVISQHYIFFCVLKLRGLHFHRISLVDSLRHRLLL